MIFRTEVARSPAGEGASGMAVQGIDVSKYQGKIDFGAVKAADKSFVFVKATEGDTGVDPSFASNIAASRAAGLMTGAYHFYISHDAAESQFANFSKHVSLGAGDLPPVVDIENLASHSPDGWQNTLRQFLQLLEKHYGVQPIIYSGVSFANSYLSGFQDYPLWVAQYTSAPQPKVPADWKVWSFWQYSQSGNVAGIAGAVDLNCFNGAEAQLRKFLIG
ncbi:MAG: GH25 family lysozyme [Pseudomonadota bacterium]